MKKSKKLKNWGVVFLVVAMLVLIAILVVGVIEPYLVIAVGWVLVGFVFFRLSKWAEFEGR